MILGAPPAIIFVNNDLSDNVKAVLVRQLFINEVMDGYEFDDRVAADPNYPKLIKANDLRIMVVRSFRDTTNRDLADIVLFVKFGLGAVEKNNFGVPGYTIPLDRMYFSELILFKGQ